MQIDRVDDEKVFERFFACEYQDRGMLKWGGYFLSDHTSALQQMFVDEQPEVLDDKQELAEISQRLADAWLHQQPVHVQLNQLQKGELIESLTGKVRGMDDDKIVVQSSDERYSVLELEEIRNVRMC